MELTHKLKAAAHLLEKPPLFWILVLALLGIMGAVLLTSSLQESNTWDEPGHLANGYVYLKTGNFWFDQVNPALGRMIVALPLLAVNPRLPLEHESWRTYDMLTFRWIFLYRNRVGPDTLMLLGRLPVMTLTLVLGLVLALWARKHFGPATAVFALLFYTLDPNIIANGRYTTTDLMTALFVFFSCILWARYLATKRWWDLVAAGVVVGLALATKHSMVFLFGLYPLLYLIRKWQKPSRLSIMRLVVSMVVIAVLGTVVVAAVYWPVSVNILFKGQALPLGENLDTSTPAGQTFKWVGETLHLPLHPYLMGFYWLARMNERGTPAYLLGENSMDGWWYFFPVAFAVKTPTAVLIGLLLSIAAVIGAVVRGFPLKRIRDLPFCWIVVVVVPAVYFLLAMTSNIVSGVRHLLPIYPFLFILVCGILLTRKSAILVLVLLAGFQVFESARIYPHHLAFFNTLSGGSENGSRYLVDCNLDWGQDVKKLKAYMDSNGIEEICLNYFGTGDLDYYGIRHRPLPRTWQEEERKNLDCMAAVSVTSLLGPYDKPGSFDWLRELEPVDHIGHTIYMYDLRKDRQSGTVTTH